MPLIPFVCMKCKRVYKHDEGMPPWIGAVSHGYCPDCAREMEMEWHGKLRVGVTA